MIIASMPLILPLFFRMPMVLTKIVRVWHVDYVTVSGCMYVSGVWILVPRKVHHPEPNLHLRRYIKCLTSHCLRVTAAVALFNSGEKDDMIAFCLHWNLDTVHIYLRDLSTRLIQKHWYAHFTGTTRGFLRQPPVAATAAA
jgi:hypothetical protein